MTVEGEAQALDAQELLDRLKALLASADPATGALDPGQFWEFVAAIGQGRGITTRLHEAGLEELATVRPPMLRGTNALGGRAYHIGLLARLVMDVGGPPERASVLPANFNHGAIAGDLMTMLGGPRGIGQGKPQILTSERGGLGALRHHARRALVGAVYWRAAHEGRRVTQIREHLLPDLEKTTWDGWLQEVGGADGDLARAAREAGSAGRQEPYWSSSDEQLARVVELARRAQGRRNAE